MERNNGGAASDRAADTAARILLHWVIAVLVVFQLIFGEDIVPAYRAMRRGARLYLPTSSDGISRLYRIPILVLAVVRLAIRLIRGSACASRARAPSQWIAACGRFLCATIFLMPVTGALAVVSSALAQSARRMAAKSVIIAAVVTPPALGSTSLPRPTCV